MQVSKLQKFARFGYAARGLVYLLIGGLAFLAALGNGGQTTDSKGALATLLEQPFGYVILGAVALGLVCFCAWRCAQSLFDADHLGVDAMPLVRRFGYAVSAIANLGLAFSAGRLALGMVAASKDDAAAKDWTAYLLGVPFGQWLVGILGLIVAGVGIGLWVKAWKAKFEDHLAIDEDARRWVRPMGRLGFGARGLVFLLIGGFLCLAAYRANSGEAQGLAGTLRTIQAQPYGWLLLVVTGAGLFAFGLFQFVVARYRRIDVPNLGDMQQSFVPNRETA